MVQTAHPKADERAGAQAGTGVPPAFIVIIAGMVAALHIGKIPPAIPVLRDALRYLSQRAIFADGLRAAFADFDPDAVASFDDTDVTRLMADAVSQFPLPEAKGGPGRETSPTRSRPWSTRSARPPSPPTASTSRAATS